MNNDLGQKIKNARRSLGWSQEKLAEEAGTSQSTIERIENGGSVRSRFLPEIASLLGIQLPVRKRVPPNIQKYNINNTGNIMQEDRLLLVIEKTILMLLEFFEKEYPPGAAELLAKEVATEVLEVLREPPAESSPADPATTDQINTGFAIRRALRRAGRGSDRHGA
jgi:transcriptional regulator with XRE-family HTH domain